MKLGLWAFIGLYNHFCCRLLKCVSRRKTFSRFSRPSLFTFLTVCYTCTPNTVCLYVCLSVELIEHIGIYKNPQTKYVKPQSSYLFTSFVYNYWFILYCAWVLTFRFFFVCVFNVSLWCSGWFCTVQVGRVQFYPKRVPPACFLWLGQTSHDNQNIIIIIII